MGTKRQVLLRFAAFAAALTVTAGAAMPAQKGALTVAPTIAYAADAGQSGKDGPLSYTKYSDHAEINFCDYKTSSVEIPETIDGVPVTKIGIYAFNGGAVTSITIPDSVVEIGDYAFAGCKSLTSVKLSADLEKVGIRAFEQCPLLETVEFPDKVVEFSSKVFNETPWLTAQRENDPLVIVNDSLIDAEKTEGKVVIPSSVKSVAASAFADNTNVTSVVFPAGVNKVKDNTFYKCSNLTSIECTGAESIGIMAFSYCNKLTNVSLSSKLKTIDMYAFSDISGSSGTITFYGTSGQWESVEKIDTSDYLKNANIIFGEMPDEDEKGDVNGDGEFGTADLVLFQRWLLGDKTAELKNWEAADLCQDNRLDVYDLVLMRKAVVNK